MSNSEQMGFYANGKIRWGLDTTTNALVPLVAGYAIGSSALPATIYATALSGLTSGFPTGSVLAKGTNGSALTLTYAEEEVTLSTSGATTDSTANLLPAKSLILGVVARVTTTVTTATDWKLGDASTDDRFTAANSTMTAGTTDVSVTLWDHSKAAGYTPWQVAAAKVRITTTGTPGAGKIRVGVYALTLTAPTS